MKDNKFDDMLKSRRFLESHDNLVERIISASYGVEQKVDINLIEWLRKLFVEFMLPKPGYALASVLVIGFLLGSSIATNDNIPLDNNSTQDFLYYDGAGL